MKGAQSSATRDRGLHDGWQWTLVVILLDHVLGEGLRVTLAEFDSKGKLAPARRRMRNVKGAEGQALQCLYVGPTNRHVGLSRRSEPSRNRRVWSLQASITMRIDHCVSFYRVPQRAL